MDPVRRSVSLAVTPMRLFMIVATVRGGRINTGALGTELAGVTAKTLNPKLTFPLS